MIASGIGTWLQVNRYGIVGSGLLSIQSVNFSFVTVMIALGSSMKSDGFHEELIMSSLLGVSFVGAFLVVGSSFILPYFTSGYYAYRQRYCGTDDRLKPD